MDARAEPGADESGTVALPLLQGHVPFHNSACTGRPQHPGRSLPPECLYQWTFVNLLFDRIVSVKKALSNAPAADDEQFDLSMDVCLRGLESRMSAVD
jgi:hypothetical protein